MKYYITIQTRPGHDPRHREYFDYTCETEQQAWDYARQKAALYGPSARVESVTSTKGERQ